MTSPPTRDEITQAVRILNRSVERTRDGRVEILSMEQAVEELTAVGYPRLEAMGRLMNDAGVVDLADGTRFIYRRH